ncbi:MAG: hypothetical protein AAFZ91_05965 [Pseudomonadota bacterium]
MRSKNVLYSLILSQLAALALSACQVGGHAGSAPHTFGDEGCRSAFNSSSDMLSVDGIAARTLFLEDSLLALGDVQLTSPEMEIVGAIVRNADEDQLRQCRRLNQYQIVATRIDDIDDQKLLEIEILEAMENQEISKSVLRCFILASTDGENEISKCILNTPSKYKVDNSVDWSPVS